MISVLIRVSSVASNSCPSFSSYSATRDPSFSSHPPRTRGPNREQIDTDSRFGIKHATTLQRRLGDVIFILGSVLIVLTNPHKDAIILQQKHMVAKARLPRSAKSR